MTEWDTLELIGRSGAERFLCVAMAPDPVAGGELAYTVPGGSVVKLKVARLQLVTDVTVANRRPELIIDDGNTVFWSSESPAVQAASLTRQYQWEAGLGFEEAAFSVDTLRIGMPEFTLLPGWRVRTTTTAIVAGDDYAAGTLLLERTVLRGLAAEVAYELRLALEELDAQDAAALNLARR
jgi:hypothetical protein